MEILSKYFDGMCDIHIIISTGKPFSGIHQNWIPLHAFSLTFTAQYGIDLNAKIEPCL